MLPCLQNSLPSDQPTYLATLPTSLAVSSHTMALLKRVSSLRRSHNSYVVSRSPEPDNAERPKGMIRCHTTLLDDSIFTCDIDVSPVLLDF